MGLFDVLLGRTKPAQPNLDQLFAIPAAAITLQAATGLVPVGVGSVCFKAPEGGGFAGTIQEVRQLLRLDRGSFAETADQYGFTWLTRHTPPEDLETLVGDLHVINTSLAEAGFGPALLCTLIAFANDHGRVGLVYLYKQGTWYPYAPTTSGKRDSAIELQVRAAVEKDLRIEPDLGRWFSLKDAPGL